MPDSAHHRFAAGRTPHFSHGRAGVETNAGLAEVAVWFGNVRLAGSSGGTVTNIFVATFSGALFVAVALAVFAYVLDLVLYFNHCTRITPASQTADA